MFRDAPQPWTLYASGPPLQDSRCRRQWLDYAIWWNVIIALFQQDAYFFLDRIKEDFFAIGIRISDCSQWVRSINYVTRKIYVLIENNPIIRTHCKKILNFQIYIPYDLNKVCRNIYTYGTYNRKLRVRYLNCLLLLHCL